MLWKFCSPPTKSKLKEKINEKLLSRTKSYDIKKSLVGLANIITLVQRILHRNQLKKNNFELQQKKNEEILKKQLLHAKQRDMINKKKHNDVNEILYLFLGSGRRF